VAINVPIITTFADKGINAAEKAFGNLSKSTLIAGAAIGGAVTAVAAFAYSSIQKASDFNEAISKNTVVFGAISKEVENFAETANRALGLSETAALAAAGTFATFGKSAGLAGKDLSDFSIELVTLASDLASFNNTSVDEAINALGSALRGEAEPLRKFGVLLDDATLKAAATELGIYSGNKALNAQQKVLAAQKVIFEQTADAQGDFSRTSTGLAAQQKILGATLENIQTNLGQAFLPIFLKAVKFFNDEVSPAFERVAEVIGEKGIVAGIQQALFELGPFGTKVVSVMETVAVAALITANAVGYIAQAANMAYQELKQLFSVKGLVINLLGPLGQVYTAVERIRGQQAGKGGFKQLFDIEGLRADFDKFSAGIMNMGSASDYSSFAAKKLAEDAEAAANAITPPGGGGVSGAADKAAKKLKALQKAAEDAAEALRREIAAAVKEATDALNTELEKALDTAKDNLDKAKDAYNDYSESVSDGILSTLSFSKVLSDADEESKKVTTSVKEAAKAIASGLKESLEDAQTELKNTKATFTDFAKTVASGIKESFSFKSANEGTDGFITGLRNQVEAIGEYNNDIQALLARGLSQDALKQILAAGTESGAAIAKGLLAGAQDDITGSNGVNALVASVQETSDQLGLATAEMFYGEGVTAAQDYLDGIQAEFNQATEKVKALETGVAVTTSFVTGLQSQISGISQYAADINTLLSMGLSQEALQLVLDAGATSGAAIAHELVTGAQENITGPLGVNALVADIKKVAGAIGVKAADQWYAAGVTNAQEYLKGVEDAIAVAQSRLDMAGSGLTLADIKGITAGFFDQVTNGYTPTAYEEFMTNSPFSMGDNGNIVYNINVTGGMSTSAEIGEVIINNIRAYNRAAGPASISVA
jgi:hypothetical protein